MRKDHRVPSLRSIWLGQRMRHLRNEQGLTIKYVASAVEVDFSLIARFERGEHPLTRDQMTTLLAVYRLYEPRQREMLLRLAQAVWRPRWEVDFDGAVPDEAFVDVLWLESEADRIRIYSPLTIPDLLGAERSDDDPANPQERLAAERRHALHGQPPVDLTVVMDECALWHPHGDRRPPLEAGASVRVLPAQAPRPPGATVPFTIYCLPDPYPPAVVHIEHLSGRLLLTDASPYLTLFEALRRTALDPDQSRQLIATAQNTNPSQER
ncbi:helix-turn-helix transcriptional regulator [Phytohabitans aurantiacus]|nr:helix-turn-helix transcriptional regulator [Phytohabitans aurantiacus]